jgi:hypothetical protein
MAARRLSGVEISELWINGQWDDESHMIYLDKQEIPIKTAVDFIELVLRNPDFVRDRVFSDFMRYLKSMYPRDTDELGITGPPRKILWPSINGPEFDSQSGPEIAIEGRVLSRNDTMIFIDYVLTNLPLQPDGNDPRLSLLDRLRDGYLS